MADIEMRLLGRFQVCAGGAEIDEQAWSRKKAKVLVKLLALAPKRQMHREQLVELLWPEADGELGLNNFHKIVHAARRALEPELRPGSTSRFLLTQETLVSLAPGGSIWIDVEDFEQRAAVGLERGESALLEAAAEAYRGDLLEEDLYEDWASLRREQLKLLHQRVLSQLAENYASSGDQRAAGVLNRLVGLNRANEDAHRRLMTLYAAAGRRHLALEQYRLCCDALREELETEPEAATVRLYEEILAGGGGGSAGEAAPAAVASAPVEREAQTALAPSTAEPARRSAWAAAAIVVAVAGVAAGLWMRAGGGPGRHEPVKSLAILPIQTRGGGEAMEFIAEGLTEELINTASRLPGVRVMARGTMFAFKGRGDATAVGRELKVAAVLSAHLQERPGGGFRLTAELVDVADGARIWGQDFTSTPGELAGLQRRLSTGLAAALEAPLSDRQRQQQSRASTANTEAYRLYLSGRYFANQRTRESLRRSIEYYQQAIALDGSYALAYAGLADSHGLLGFADAKPGDYFPKAREYAEKAIQLDDSLAEAYTSLAMVRALYEWNWAGAQQAFQQAIERNAGYATAHHWYGVHLSGMRRFAEAERELERALELDPLSPIINVNRGYPAYFQKRFEEALRRYDKALELKPDFAIALQDRALALEVQGKAAEAAVWLTRHLRAEGEKELAEGMEGAAGADAYRRVLRDWLDAVEKKAAREHVAPMMPAALAARAGDRERCLRWLERAYEQRSPPLVYVAADPVYDSLRGEARFVDLLRRMNLPQAANRD